MAWLRSFIQHWSEAVERNHINSLPLRPHAQEALIKKISEGRRCFIVLNYEAAFIPNTTFTELLKSLGTLSYVELTLVTQHSRDYCIRHLNCLPMNIIAEQGAFLLLKEENNWEASYGIDEFHLIEQEVLPLLERYCKQVPGSIIERKQLSLSWNYRRADSAFGCSQARNLLSALAQLLENTPFRIYHHHQILEVRSVNANKGCAVEQILHRRQFQHQDLLITIGHDETDEEMYKLKNSHNISIHVGAPNLFAKYHLTSATETQQLLKNIAAGFPETISLNANPA